MWREEVRGNDGKWAEMREEVGKMKLNVGRGSENWEGM